jgi:hypothetical protein
VWDENLGDHVTAGSTGAAVTDIASQSVSSETKIDEIHKLHGLDAAAPLAVSPTQRTAGATIIQDIVDNNGTVTITRIP